MGKTVMPASWGTSNLQGIEANLPPNPQLLWEDEKSERFCPPLARKESFLQTGARQMVSDPQS